MPRSFNWSDDGDTESADLPLKTKKVVRPDAEAVKAATKVAEANGFATRTTVEASDDQPQRRSGGDGGGGEGEPRRRRKRGRPRGPKSERVTYDLYAEDVQRFFDLCEDEWECTYKQGFQKLLAAYEAQAAKKRR